LARFADDAQALQVGARLLQELHLLAAALLPRAGPWTVSKVLITSGASSGFKVLRSPAAKGLDHHLERLAARPARSG